MSGTVEKVRVSLAFTNVCKAMDIVFGPGGWAPGMITPDVNPDDFDMFVDIGDKKAVAYITACRTYQGHDGFGPGGLVGVEVEGNEKSIFEFRDGRPREAVEHFVGTPEEQKSFRWGADGVKVDRIVKYLRILERYLDQRGESQPAESEEPPASDA